MATKSVIKVQIEAILKGRENVPGLKKDLKALEAAVLKVKKSMDFTSVVVGFGALKSSIQSVTNVVHELCGAYATQIEAETKLATTMRNTMDAREKDIQSIKDLCAAQQELGVIGDEVQLAGAQELATYLSEKQSLEQLIPVMNDMLAQQYGLNASQENAAQIATMLGKVMNGQTGALSRYGYTFDAAQEQILKFGTESERAAVLCDVVNQSVKGVNAELAKTDAGNQKQLANTIGDIKENIGRSLQPFQKWVELSSQALTGAAALGQLSAATQAIKGFTKATLGAVASSKAVTAASAIWNSKNKALTAALILGRGKIDQATFATNLYRTAAKGSAESTIVFGSAMRGLMSTLGVGVALTAISVIISKISDATTKAKEGVEKMRKAEESLKRETEELENFRKQEVSTLNSTRAALDINISKLQDFNGTKEQEKKLVAEMNDTYGDTMGYFSSVADWYKALTANSETYCRQMVIEARTRILADRIAKKEQELYDTTHDEAGNTLKFSPKREEGFRNIDGPAGAYTGWVEIEGSSELEKAQAKVNAIKSNLSNMRNLLKDSVKEAGKIDYAIKGSATRPDSGSGSGIQKEKTRLQELSDLIEKAKERYVNASETERTEIRQNINAWIEEKNAIEALHKEAEKPLDIGHIPALEEIAKNIRDRLDKATDLNLAAKLNTELEKVNRQISYWQSYKGPVNTELKLSTDATKLLPALDGTIKLREKTDEAAAAQEALRRQMELIGGAANNVGGIFSTLGSVIGGAAQSMLDWAATTIDAIAQVIPQISTLITAKQGEAIAGATASGSSLPFPFNIVSVAAGVAAVLAQFAKIPKFADGGIAFGPTLGLFGEYAGAANNPEVVAPLNDLRSLLAPQPALAGDVRFIIEGDKLVGVMDRRLKRINRT